MLQMTFVNCIAILSNYFGGEVKFVLVAKVNKSLTRIFSEKISECFRINTNASKTWLKYRPLFFNQRCTTFKHKGTPFVHHSYEGVCVGGGGGGGGELGSVSTCLLSWT